METFWDRVQVYCGTRTVVELAKMLDVKRSTLSSWINGDRRPPMDVAMRIANIAGISLEQLEYGIDWFALHEDDDEVDETETPLMGSIIHQFKTLDIHQLEFVKIVLDYIVSHPAPGNTIKDRTHERMR